MRTKTFAITVAAMAALILPAALAAPTQAIDVFNDACKGAADRTSVCGEADGGKDEAFNIIETIISTLLIVAGMIAVVMIVIGGFKYVMSAGDNNATTAAKNTVLYAVIGLVVAIMAYTIVNFVVGNF